MTTTLLGGSGMSCEKGLGLGVTTPPNNNRNHLILLILEYGGPKTHN